MSQNDFTIANQGFPAFRADLNSALQALASNNSGATAPSTTFSNMWWYDSANNIMYIRNEDNDAWIKFAELDQANDKFVLSGTLQLDDGTVSAPALTFNSDTNMGIYRGGTDILKFVTAGTDAVTIDASQNMTLAGTLNVESSTTPTINIKSTDAVVVADDVVGAITFEESDATGGTGVQAFIKAIANDSGNTYDMSIGVGGNTEAIRIDQSADVTLAGAVIVSDVKSSTNLTLEADFENDTSAAASKIQFKNDGVLRGEFVAGGDFQLYEDTGTTPKLFWDASVQALSVNESTIISGGTAATTPSIQASEGGTAGAGFGVVSANDEIAGQLRIAASSQNAVYLEADPSNQRADSWLGFRVDGNNVGRFDSSGNLLVGRTSSTSSTVGCELDAIGRGMFTRDAGLTLILNRETDDGDIVQFRRSNSVVGSIGVSSSQTFYAGANIGIRFYSAGFTASDASGSEVNDAYDIGSASTRWDDVYATNGTIQTSDQNEKNTITDSDLGIDFIKRLTPKSYIFNGKTRTHYGLIAQDVETVLSDINKPTSGFAGFIKTDISEEQDGSEYRYGLRYTEFVAPLIQAVKDQQATIDALTARITALENGE